MPVNRIAKHLEPDRPPVPSQSDYRGRYEFVSEAVLRAVAAVTRLLDDEDPAVVLKAAKMILDLEKTRMRHGCEVHGAPTPESVERAAMLGPLPGDPDYNYGTRTVTPEVAAELEKIRQEEGDDFYDDDDFDDSHTVRPISYVMGVAPLPPPSTAKLPDPEADDDPALTGEEEYQRWVTGYYYRDRASDIPAGAAIPREVGCAASG